jgi:diguanylate cyclase (GGDEF)-like protein
MQEQGEALQRLAETDPLTWLFNRRHFDRRLEAETNRALRAEHLLALLMIDVDRFKLYNDRYGHAVGDEVLKAVAAAVKQAVRLYDVPTRYGGDEFAIILPDADTEAATRVATRILEKATDAALPAELVAARERLQLSIGIATFPRPAGDAAALVESADAAMYRAKESGGGIRVWEHSLGEGPRGAIRSRAMSLPAAPYLADPARLATAELQKHLPHALASEWNAVVVGHEGQVLTVALPQPNPAAVDSISKATGFAVYPVFSNAADLEATRRRLTTSNTGTK